MMHSARRRFANRSFARRPVVSALLAVAAAAALFAAIAALPNSAGAAATRAPGYAAYQISFVDNDTAPRSDGALVGRLSLCQNQGGALDGFLLMNDGGRDYTIEGSRDGNSLNVHTAYDLSGLDVNGTLQDGKISGAGTMAFHHYTFAASPERAATDGAADLPPCR